jgi:hypothetical protein
MMIKRRTEVFYCVEMTTRQAHNLQLLLQTGVNGHVSELKVQTDHGEEIATNVHETIKDLLLALESR